MFKSKKQKAAATAEAPAVETPTQPVNDVFDDAIADRQREQAAAIIQQVAAATETPPEHTHASQHAHSKPHLVEKKKYSPPADPFGFENIKAGENRIRLLKSEGEGAWVIRFAHNPNEDKGLNGENYGKANPHPVLKMLKDEGYRWGFDGGDGKGGWGKAFSGDPYGTDHMEARRVLQLAAQMVGAPKPEQGRIPE